MDRISKGHIRCAGFKLLEEYKGKVDVLETCQSKRLAHKVMMHMSAASLARLPFDDKLEGLACFLGKSRDNRRQVEWTDISRSPMLFRLQAGLTRYLVCFGQMQPNKTTRWVDVLPNIGCLVPRARRRSRTSDGLDEEWAREFEAAKAADPEASANKIMLEMIARYEE